MQKKQGSWFKRFQSYSLSLVLAVGFLAVMGCSSGGDDPPPIVRAPVYQTSWDKIIPAVDVTPVDDTMILV